MKASTAIALVSIFLIAFTGPGLIRLYVIEREYANRMAALRVDMRIAEIIHQKNLARMCEVIALQSIKELASLPFCAELLNPQEPSL